MSRVSAIKGTKQLNWTDFEPIWDKVELKDSSFIHQFFDQMAIHNLVDERRFVRGLCLLLNDSCSEQLKFAFELYDLSESTRLDTDQLQIILFAAGK